MQDWVSQPKHAQLLQDGFDDEEQVGASTSILDIGSPEAKPIQSWFSIA